MKAVYNIAFLRLFGAVLLCDDWPEHYYKNTIIPNALKTLLPTIEEADCLKYIDDIMLTHRLYHEHFPKKLFTTRDVQAVCLEARYLLHSHTGFLNNENLMKYAILNILSENLQDT